MLAQAPGPADADRSRLERAAGLVLEHLVLDLELAGAWLKPGWIIAAHPFDTRGHAHAHERAERLACFPAQDQHTRGSARGTRRGIDEARSCAA